MATPTKVTIGGVEYEIIRSPGLASYNAGRCSSASKKTKNAMTSFFNTLWLFMLGDAFDTPSHLAATITQEEVPEAIKALSECMKDGEPDAKNSDASVGGPSPA